MKKRFLECVFLVGEVPSQYSGNRKYVSTGAVDEDHIDYDKVEDVDYSSKPSRANLTACSGDILFAKMQNTRKTLLIEPGMEDYIFSTGFYAVRANENVILPECLFFLIDSEVFLRKKDKLCTGATMKAITNAGLKDIWLDVPELTEQKSIARKLELISKQIANRRKQLDMFDQLVKSRFIELFGTVTENPYGFPMATLKEVCHKITDGKHGGCEQEADSGYYYVGAREIYDDCIHYDTAPQITYADFAKDYKRCNIERGDMVIVNTGATIGKTAIATSPLTERTLLQKSVALLKVKTEIISAEFLRHCYMANPSMYRVESASAQPNLLLSRMNATRIYLPPIDLQEQFAAFVEQTDKSKLAVLKALEELEILKKSLMQQYFG